MSDDKERTKFRKELERIMPGYNWTIHRNRFQDTADYLEATGIQSAGFNRISTLSVTRRSKNGIPRYEVKSAGFGKRAPWLASSESVTLANALRVLQNHYEAVASNYARHAHDLQLGRQKPKGQVDAVIGNPPEIPES
ncbi:MAG: hypothetical protein WC455_15130 [Dehalococcoidia bacterium]|jgi:hypothetical protein